MRQDSETVRYASRTVQQWVETASNGKMALADFQRSFVWDTGKATEYIEAILMGKPVGLYLILATSEQPQFHPRPFYNVETALENVTELVLDGQQRLTSILHAIHGLEERRYFIEVDDLSADDLEVKTVICETKNFITKKTVRGLDGPETAYAKNLIPVDILNKTVPGKGELSRLADWCITVGEKVPEMDDRAARLLEERIRDLADRCFFQREIWYCRLPSTTDASEAAEIFVATNTSSVRIKKFDIEVATVRGRYDEDLRSAIEAAYGKSSMLSHYFPDEPQDYIPAIGEWLLKVACLHQGHAPKDAKFGEAVKYLLEGRGTEINETANDRLDSVFDDLDWALKCAERWGAPTDKMIPSWPVLHVTSALRGRMEQINDPAELGRARRLLKAYYWRCLFSNRHEVQANDRLHEDYRELSEALDTRVIESCSLTAFHRDHPLYDDGHLLRHARWITSSRLGKALVSVVMASDPKPSEWITGDSMDHAQIRELQSLNKLHRHHVYPKAVLKAGGVEEEKINNGLNGTLLDQRTNLRLWGDPPNEYVEKILDDPDLPENALKQRIESHMVPYDTLTETQGSVKVRYRCYLDRRAKILAARIQDLATFEAGPGGN